MALGILVLLTALSISAVAIYYSVAGLVAIFAAAALPIMIMGGVLEVGKLVTAVWLHKYWDRTVWWLRTYLATAVVVLMLITSMGIFGFLSKAHIEQTSASEETVARVAQIETEVGRLNAIIERADQKIKDLENKGTGADANVQAQIDKEQERIDKAFERIAPAIEQQNKIIADARGADADRTKPYEDQLKGIQDEILRLEQTAREYEDKIANLDADTSAVEPLLAQIKKIEEDIIRVTNQLQSTEQSQIRAGQAIIGVTSDGLFGTNTRTALAKWVKAQQDRISQIQGEISQLRTNATSTVDSERERLAGVIKDIRERQIKDLKDRELVMLGKIDEVRQTESPVIQTARDEIQRLRKSAEDQVSQSQELIARLQKQLGQTDNTAEIDTLIDEQTDRIRLSTAEIDTLTEEKYALQAEYRKLEAEVGPIKYIAEFIYGETADRDLLEEAVRWVIITIIFVFDPLAVLLLIASQYTFAYHRGGNTPPTGGKDDDPEDPKEDPTPDSEVEPEVNDRTDDSEPVATTVTEETNSVEATPAGTDQGDTPRSGGTEEEKDSLVDETIKQMKQDEQWWQDEKSLAGQVKVDDEGKVVTEDDGTVEVEAPAMREYQSATGERVKIKADLLAPKKPQVKEKNLEDMIRGADEDVLERVYKEMVTEGNTNQTIKSEGEDTEKKLEENTHWLPLQRKQ
jgi:hypothetical protein